jgi:hypothetical protein
MENEQTKLQIEEFVDKVNALKEEMLRDKHGFVLFAYEELDKDTQSNSCSASGKLSRIAECFVSLMKSDPAIANVMIAAANAIVQRRVLESQILAEAQATTDTKKKTKKSKKTN